MFKYFIFLFALISTNASIIGQNYYYVISSDSIQLQINKHVSKIKKKLCCDSMDFLKDNRYKTVLDTTLFKYIPIFHSSLQMSYTIEKKKISPLISEVLVYEKKEKKIIGSVLTDKNNKYIVSFCKYKNYVGRMPIRPENRLTYIPQKQYGKIEKFISHNHKKGYFFTIEDIGGVFFMLENNKIITICSPDI